MHAALRRQDAGRFDPILRNELAGEFLRARLRGIVAPEAAHQALAAVEHLEHHHSPGVVRQKELDDRARRRIGGERLVRWNRRVAPGAALHAVGVGGTQQHHLVRRGTRDLPQPRDVVEDPDRAAVGRQDEVVVVDPQVAHRGMREIQLQRLPVLPVIGRAPHGALGGGEQQSAALRILAHGIHGGVRRQAAGNRLPGPAPVVGAVDVRAQIVDAHAAHRDIGAIRIEVRGLDLRDLAPRRQRRGGDVRPLCPAVGGHPHQPVIGARPQRVDTARRDTECVDDTALPLRSRQVQRADAGGNVARLSREVGADRLPGRAPVARPVEAVGAVIERVRVERRK